MVKVMKSKMHDSKLLFNTYLISVSKTFNWLVRMDEWKTDRKHETIKSKITTHEKENERRWKRTNEWKVEVRRKEGERFIDTWALSSSFLFLVWQDAASCRLAGTRSSVYTQASDPRLQTYSWYNQERGGGGSEEERGEGRIWTDKQGQVKQRDRENIGIHR